MTLPTSGIITFADINIELGKSATDSISLNDSDVRSLAGVPSGTIRMSDFYGKSAAAPLSASIDPDFVSGNCNGNSCTATTGAATVTVIGGNSPYSYQWERVSGDVFNINSINNATTTFNRIGTDQFFMGTYRCRVTDSNSNVALTNNITVNSVHSVENDITLN